MTPAKPSTNSRKRLTDAFCLRLTLAILYRAGLDALDTASFEACEAREFLKSDFAQLAHKVLLSRAAQDVDFGDTSDYLGQFRRMSSHRNRKLGTATHKPVVEP